MKLGNWDEYVAQRGAKHPQYAYPDEDIRKVRDRRKSLRSRFPYVITVVGGHEEHDDCTFWLWSNVGPEDGPCKEGESFNPACTVAQAFRPQHKCEQTGKLYYGFADNEEVPEHDHEGEWLAVYIRKTSYDYGYCDYGFTDAASADKFRSWVALQEPHEQDMSG